jgi:hypothetical protein
MPLFSNARRNGKDRYAAYPTPWLVALHGASDSFDMKKSATALTLAGRVRAVGVTQ